jgi:hypothetical protein
MSLPWPPHYSPYDVAKHATQNGVVAVHVDDLKRWQTEMQDAFDLGFKAAGGTEIPDGARNMIELAIDRTVLNELCDLVEAGEVGPNYPMSDGLRQFLENVNIYRKRK